MVLLYSVVGVVLGLAVVCTVLVVSAVIAGARADRRRGRDQ